MMLSTKTLFFALIVVTLSSFTSVCAAQVPRFMMEDGNHTDSHDDHFDCHCEGDEVHCDHPAAPAKCHCHGGEVFCDHDESIHSMGMDKDSGAFGVSLMGSAAIAGVLVAAAAL